MKNFHHTVIQMCSDATAITVARMKELAAVHKTSSIPFISKVNDKI
jgi:hypothetical protein